MDGTDADGEWSDEEMLRSGSQTGVSDDQDTGHSSGQDKRRARKSSVTREDANPIESDTHPPRQRQKNHHHRPSLGSIIKNISSGCATDAHRSSWDNHNSGRTPIVTSSIPAAVSSGISTSVVTTASAPGTHRMMTSAPDPVSAILDKIDAQIDSMDATDMKVVPTLTSGDKKSPRQSKSGSYRSKSGQPGDTGVASFHDTEFSEADKVKAISGSAEVLSEANLTDGLTDDERARRLDSDIPSDLDSVAAQQIDIKFKEIMRKKKDSPDEAAQEIAELVREVLKGQSVGSRDPRGTSHLQREATAASPDEGEIRRSRSSRRERNSEGNVDVAAKPRGELDR